MASQTLIPLFKNDKLAKSLNTIARRFSIDPAILNEDFTAESGEVFSTYFKKKGETSRLFLVGLGDDMEPQLVTKSLKGFFINSGKKIKNILTVDLSLEKKNEQEILAEAIVNSAITGSYKLGLYKTGEKGRDPLAIEIVAGHESIKAHIDRAKDIATTQVSIMDLVNAPSNKLYPEVLGKWAVQSGKEFGYQVKVMHKKEIVENGLNSVLAVNQGSDKDPVFIIAEYKHKKAVKSIGLVGKGVTFDTGGLSIKPSANMHYMKSDMGGAAAALGTIEAVAKLGLPINLTVIVPSVENSVDATSIKPGDIIDSYSGKTIEVIDTDAEGRLILADALAYLTKHYQTDFLIDFATLTGSVIATLGYHAAGLFTNSALLENGLKKAGDKCGERIWPLPIWKAYEEDLHSDVADVKNYSGKPIAGAITAAKFLEVFINEHPNWCHVDIAGTAFGDSPLGKQKHATAFGINLMVNFLEGLK